MRLRRFWRWGGGGSEARRRWLVDEGLIVLCRTQDGLKNEIFISFELLSLLFAFVTGPHALQALTYPLPDSNLRIC